MTNYPIWSTRFQVFAQTKGFLDTLTVVPPNTPERLGNQPTGKKRAVHDADEAAYRRAHDDIEKHKNTRWCYLAMVLESTSLILILHDCVDHKAHGDGHKAWDFLQERFRSNETVTVVRLVRQLARLQLKEDKHNYFILAHELLTRLEQAGEHLPEPLLNVMVLNGLTEPYEHFVVQQSIKFAGSFVELRTKLSNYDENRLHREKVDDDN